MAQVWTYFDLMFFISFFHLFELISKFSGFVLNAIEMPLEKSIVLISVILFIYLLP